MLTPDGCRARQERFRTALGKQNLAGALVTDARDIYYLTGLWVENRIFGYPSLLFLGTDKPSWLGTWRTDGCAVVDQRETYDHSTFRTVHPDNHRRLAPLAAACGRRVAGVAGLGYQAEGAPKFVLDAFLGGAGVAHAAPIDELMHVLQRRKDADEMACIRRAVRALQAGFARAREVIAPGALETDVLAECQAAAQRDAGRPHRFGGDFRSGSDGGQARRRPIESGEVYIVDA
ncbi:MAG TPA: aminopeptidase P family N-terminal domain-containing protein, partial [Planctomycetia bacterium]|nr:aminopeptidase P family N-terminal domain-containing protein [Planctomycetia bacterium]